MIKKEATKLNVTFADNIELISNPTIIDFYSKRIEKIQEEFTP